MRPKGQDALRARLRDCVWLVAANAILLAFMLASDLATISRVRHAQGLVVRHAHGVVDTWRDEPWRRPVLRLARWRADPQPLLFTCQKFAQATGRCPTVADWTARELGVDWIDLQTGLTGQFVHRATSLRAGDDVTFSASVDDVRDGEVASTLSAMKTGCAIFGSAIVLFGSLALLARHKLRAHAKLVAAANRRAAANAAAAEAAADARRLRL
jgi:hypothetical protein